MVEFIDKDIETVPCRANRNPILACNIPIWALHGRISHVLAYFVLLKWLLLHKVKRLLTIVYWCAAILMVAAVVMSMGYRFTESLFIGTLFMPGALAVKYFYPKVSFDDKASGIKDTIFITIGVILGEILLFIMAHYILQMIRDSSHGYYNWEKLPDILLNPVFIAIIIAVLSAGNVYFEKWLGKRFPTEHKPITFLSDRRSISLMTDEILFIESNDTVTIVVATEDRRYRNKTPISQWESILGDGFIRIHRSYLVNKSHIEDYDKDSVTVSGYELPISRRHKGSISISQ